DVDGQYGKVRLQHCLGVAFVDGSIYVADTYNNKIKQIDPQAQTCKTIAGGQADANAAAAFDEPAGISAAGRRLFIADTNNHLIRVIDLDRENKVGTLTIEGLEAPVVKTTQPKVKESDEE
ncbi:MAG TPA: hypothetical protein VF278_20590, partial [Pirellulales bacterium]